MTANGSGLTIRVFDESGEWIGTTYPKRARGLVRNGRARWLADTSENNGPDPGKAPGESDSIVLFRTKKASGAEARPSGRAPQKKIIDYSEDTMNEFNNKNENELRIQGMIEKFQAEMARAREIAEKAAAEAQAAMEAARSQSKAAGEADSCGDGAQKTVTDTLKDLGGKLNEAAETAAEGIREAASEIAKNETVRETVSEVKSAGDALISDAKKKLDEAEERLSEARRAYEEAEKSAEAAEDEVKETVGECGDLSKQVKENMKELADEAGAALKTAWTELKKGWKELSAASSESFEWLKENTKDARETVKGAFREFGDSVRSMMNDVGDAGDGTDADEPKCDEDESCESSRNADEGGLGIEWTIPEDEEAEAEDDGETEGSAPSLTEFDRAQAEAMKTASDIRAAAAEATRKSIEDEINAAKARTNETLKLVKEQYDAGKLSFEQYMEYTDKYTDALHARLTELREELKSI